MNDSINISDLKKICQNEFDNDLKNNLLSNRGSVNFNYLCLNSKQISIKLNKIKIV
jgi:hypothetical protein